MDGSRQYRDMSPEEFYDLAGDGRTTETVKGNADNIAALQSGKADASTTVNGKALSGNITLTAADVSAIPESQKGAANGVATINNDGYVMQCVGAGRKSGTPIGTNSTAEGSDATASGDYSHAEGISTTASGGNSHAEGWLTTASGDYSPHAEGEGTTASGDISHAEGSIAIASGYVSHAEGHSTQANVMYSHAQGTYNKTLAGDPKSYSATADAMVIGNGTGSSALSNCFRITFGGNVYGLSSYHSSGADYSEFFEWLDENPNKEDRAGHFVTLDGEKIKYANDGDYIVGIISGNPVIVGDHPSESWKERYLRDVFGRLQYEDVTIPETQEKDKDGNVIRTIPEHTETHFKVNPDYDPTKEAEYENREKRPEWATVGMLGKLVVIDDGTCEVNGYCKPTNGIATKADTGYRVLARLDATHIKVLIK